MLTITKQIKQIDEQHKNARGVACMIKISRHNYEYGFIKSPLTTNKYSK